MIFVFWYNCLSSTIHEPWVGGWTFIYFYLWFYLAVHIGPNRSYRGATPKYIWKCFVSMFMPHRDLDTRLILISRINFLLFFVFSWNLLTEYITWFILSIANTPLTWDRMHTIAWVFNLCGFCSINDCSLTVHGVSPTFVMAEERGYDGSWILFFLP